MEGKKGKKGYVWAISAGFNAAFAAIAAKLFSSMVISLHFFPLLTGSVTIRIRWACRRDNLP